MLNNLEIMILSGKVEIIMRTSKVEATNKIAIKGDRSEPIIAAIQNIQINHPELYKELNKVIDYELWDGYSLMIHEEIS